MGIQAGDTVRCRVDYYSSYEYGETAVVKKLDVSSTGNPVLILPNPLCQYGQSMYSIDNWEFVSRPKSKETNPMGYVKTKYFAMMVRSEDEGTTFLPLVPTEQTVLRDTKAEALRDVRANIKEGEQWVILQTVGYVIPAPPKPVLAEISITDCR